MNLSLPVRWLELGAPEFEAIGLARRRAGPLALAVVARGGALEDAAASAYFQGIRDAVEAIEACGWPPGSGPGPGSVERWQS